MDADLFLTAETFRLSPDVTTGQRWHRTYAIKSAAARKYLTIDDRHIQVLQQFTEPRTVPEALEICIRNGTCIPLREFYDLVLKAHAAGILLIDGTTPAIAKPAARWPVKIKSNLVRIALMLAGVAAYAMLLAVPLNTPPTILDLIYGWVGVCAALSLGHVIGASVLRGAECEVYHPKVRVRFGLFPHFGVDLRDSCMADVPTRVAINGSPLLPVSILVAVGQALHARWVIIPALALLAESLPVFRTAANNLLFLLRRQPLLTTDRPALFDVQLRVREQIRLAWTRFDGRVAGLQFGIALAWTGLITFLACRALHYNPTSEVRHLACWKTPALATAAALAFITCLWVVDMGADSVCTGAVALRNRVKQLRARWAHARTITEDDIETLVRRNPLLRRLEPEAQLELVKHFTPVNWKAWKTIIKFEEKPEQVVLIARGTVNVYRRLATGRPTRFLQLEEGDMFGAHELVDPEHASLEVRTRSPVQAIAIPMEDFQRLVVRPLTADRVKRYMHEHLFLQRVSRFCRDWRPAAVGRFAELVRTTRYSAGTKIVHYGEEVHSLYVMYKGKALATRKAHRVGTLRPGDSIGEISLLQSGSATADVETSEETQCLQVNRLEFIRFLARNHRVALALEQVCKERLGAEVFVSAQNVFDGR